MIAFVIV